MFWVIRRLDWHCGNLGGCARHVMSPRTVERTTRRRRRARGRVTLV
jgi:hypothetical protein